MSDIKIFISTHKENIRIPRNPLVFPVQVGTALRNRRFEDMFHDDEGENISDRNRSYCELTAQYWAWKNVDADYYGFFHYRRYLSFAQEVFPTVHEPFIFDEVVFPDNSPEYLNRISFYEDSMRDVIEEHDFIAPCASSSLSGESVYEQYRNSAGHHIEDLDSVISIIRERFPQQVHAMEEYLGGTRMYCCNMYIMKSRLFDDYCSWLFSILEEFEDRRDLSEYPPVDGRVTGYLAERLCGIYLTWLFEKGYKGIELQKVYFRETDPSVQTSEGDLKTGRLQSSSPLNLIKKVGRSGRNAVTSGTEKAIRKVKDRIGHLPEYDHHRPDRIPVGELGVSITKAFRDRDGKVVIYFNLCEVYPSDSEIDVDYELKVTDSHDNDILIASPVLMKEYSDSVEGFEEYMSCSREYSCKLDDISDGCSLIIKGANIREKRDFSEKEISRILEEWESRTESVSYCADYHRWYLNEHRVRAQELIYQKDHVFEYEPLFSVIVPLYHTPVQYFVSMAESVLEQTYGNFELILVNSTPSDGELSDKVREYAGMDSRVRFTELQTNMGITENTNVGIEMAKGDFLCFLDHDDLLEKDALFEYAAAINDKPETDLLYCDEDKIYGDHFTDPYFKPDYNPDLLMGINYICHFLAVRSSIVDTLSQASKEFDGAQDYHMSFRVAEKARYVNHVSRILYHWRIHENSTASDPGQKSYAHVAARLALEEHLERCNIKGYAVNSLRVPRHFEVVYELPELRPQVSLIIVNEGPVFGIKACVDSILLKTSYDNYEIVIVDTAEDDNELQDYYEKISGLDNIKVVHPEGEAEYSKQINYGFLESTGEYIVLLGTGIRIISDNWIQRMLGPCMRKDIGAVGAKLLAPDGTVKHAGIIMTRTGPAYINTGLGRFMPGYYDSARLNMDVTAVSGRCIMTSRRIFTAAGGLNEKLDEFCSSIDFCLKLREAGYLILFEAGTELYDTGSEDEYRKARLMHITGLGYLMMKWGEKFVDGDPCYNRNFADGSTYFNIY